MSTIERARHRWLEILPQFGIDTRFLTNKPGPCPLCGGKDRYRFDDRDGSGSYICGQCGAGVGVILLRKLHGWDHKTACDEIDKIVGRETAPRSSRPTAATDEAKDKEKRYSRLKRALEEATDQRVVAAFLRKRRLTDGSPALRGHPALPYYEGGELVGRFPAVLAPILSADDATVTAAAIYCASAPEPRKKFLPATGTINGAAVRLCEPEGGCLGVAEGIATALAARQLFRVPTWAALSANGLKTFMPPSGISRITVFADNDSNYVGQAAAYDLAQRLVRDGFAVNVQQPYQLDTDFADLLPEPKEHS